MWYDAGGRVQYRINVQLRLVDIYSAAIIPIQGLGRGHIVRYVDVHQCLPREHLVINVCPHRHPAQNYLSIITHGLYQILVSTPP
jgi:hypothetical protein